MVLLTECSTHRSPSALVAIHQSAFLCSTIRIGSVFLIQSWVSLQSINRRANSILVVQRQKSRSSSKPRHRLSTVNSSMDFERRGVTDADRHHKVGMVTIYDSSGLLPLQYELAERYVYDHQLHTPNEWTIIVSIDFRCCRFSDTDVQWMCTQNASIAAQLGRKDLEKIWSLGSLLSVPSLTSDDFNKDIDTPWAQNPFGRKLLHAM